MVDLSMIKKTVYFSSKETYIYFLSNQEQITEGGSLSLLVLKNQIILIGVLNGIDGLSLFKRN